MEEYKNELPCALARGQQSKKTMRLQPKIITTNDELRFDIVPICRYYRAKASRFVGIGSIPYPEEQGNSINKKLEK